MGCPPVVNEIRQPPIRVLIERAALLYGLGARAFYQGRERSARWFEEQADEALRRAAEMRRAAEATGERTAAPGEAGAQRIEADS